LMWLRSSCRARRSSPAFETLSHSASRTFHHKSRLVPPSALEKFRASTTAADPSKSQAFFVLHVAGLASITRNGFRSYSQSSALQAMADQTWTGPKVRETFLNYFAKRGHSIGMPPSPHTHFLCLQMRRAQRLRNAFLHSYQKAHHYHHEQYVFHFRI
jgi:hypothetical protein